MRYQFTSNLDQLFSCLRKHHTWYFILDLTWIFFSVQCPQHKREKQGLPHLNLVSRMLNGQEVTLILLRILSNFISSYLFYPYDLTGHCLPRNVVVKKHIAFPDDQPFNFPPVMNPDIQDADPGLQAAYQDLPYLLWVIQDIFVKPLSHLLIFRPAKLWSWSNSQQESNGLIMLSNLKNICVDQWTVKRK